MSQLINISLANPQLNRENTRLFAKAIQVVDKVEGQAELLFSKRNGGPSDRDDNPGHGDFEREY